LCFIKLHKTHSNSV